MLAAGAANTINCWYDRDIDRLMSRTRDRPIPSGVIRRATRWSSACCWRGSSLVLLGVFTTPLATALAAAAVLAYSVLYTMVLKRRTHHNTVFGGLPGAAPVLIGWAAVTGSLDWPAVVFFGIVFCWQMPHFWALASRFRYDYFRAGVPMLSVVAGPVSVGRQSVAWAWGTLARLAADGAGDAAAGLDHRRRHPGPGRLVRRGVARLAEPDQGAACPTGRCGCSRCRSPT